MDQAAAVFLARTAQYVDNVDWTYRNCDNRLMDLLAGIIRYFGANIVFTPTFWRQRHEGQEALWVGARVHFVDDLFAALIDSHSTHISFGYIVVKTDSALPRLERLANDSARIAACINATIGLPMMPKLWAQQIVPGYTNGTVSVVPGKAMMNLLTQLKDVVYLSVDLEDRLHLGWKGAVGIHIQLHPSVTVQDTAEEHVSETTHSIMGQYATAHAQGLIQRLPY